MLSIILFCAALLVCVVLRANILYALAAGLVIFALYGRRKGFSWRALWDMIVSGVKTAGSVLLVFPLIGMLTAFWRASGTLPLIICCAVYAALGLAHSGGARAEGLWTLYGREMALHWAMCIPAVLILVLSLLRVKVKRAMAASILAAAALCVLLRGMDALTLLKTAFFGYTAADAEVGAMLNGGGILSMVRLMLIITISSAYSGIFRATGLLDGLCARVTALGERTTPYFAALVTSVLAGLVACNQTLTIILVHQLCAPSREDREAFAVDLENSAVVIAPLVPWSIAGAVPLATVGAPTGSLLLACFLYLLPLTMLLQRMAEWRKSRAAGKD